MGTGRDRGYARRVPLASVYPLVSTRSLARPFTYEVAEGIAKGSVLSVTFGRRSTRGVVADVGVDAPEGVEPVAAGRLLDEIPPTLVDLALWLADYYGSTPARALELVAPLRRAPRSERPSPAARESLGGEPEPATLTDGQRAAVGRIVAALDEGVGEHVLLDGPTGSGKTEVEQTENAGLVALAELEPGQRGEIVRLAEHDGDLLHWFYDEGYVPGSQVELREAQPAAGQLKVVLDSSERAIGEKAAQGLYVRLAA